MSPVSVRLWLFINLKQTYPMARNLSAICQTQTGSFTPGSASQPGSIRSQSFSPERVDGRFRGDRGRSVTSSSQSSSASDSSRSVSRSHSRARPEMRKPPPRGGIDSDSDHEIAGNYLFTRFELFLKRFRDRRNARVNLLSVNKNQKISYEQADGVTRWF